MGINANIEQFEKVFEDLDVKTEELNGALDNVYSTTIDQGEVNSLIDEMKDAHAMELGMPNANRGQVSAGQQNEVDDMQKKLDSLRNM